MEQSGISKLDLKRCNRMQILKLLRQNGPTSRIDISRSLELTRAAVTIITNEMIENGVLYKKGEATPTGKKPSRGRKKILIDIAPNYKFVLGVVVDRGIVSVGLSNLNGEVLGKRSERLPDMLDVKRMLDAIVTHARDIKAESCLTNDQILGMGLCIPTQHFQELGIFPRDNRMNFSVLTKPLEEALGYRVVAEELVNSLAMAEIDFGYRHQAKPQNMVFVRYRKDITSSVVLNNAIYFGSENKACQFGHLMVDTEGEPCDFCGSPGCLSSKISGQVLTEKIDAIYSRQRTPKLFEVLGEDAQAPGQRALNEAELFGDREICDIIADASRYFAMGLVNTIRLFDPEKIVFFGRMFENTALVNCVQENLKKYIPASYMKKFAISNLKTKAIYLAGCSAAVRELFIKRGGLDDSGESRDLADVLNG